MKAPQSKRKMAMLTGGSILMMALAAGVIMPLIFKPIFDAELDKVDQVLSVIKPYFLIGIIGWVVILITDLMVSWGLYKFYKSRENRKAEVMGGMRFLYSAGLALGIMQLIRAHLVLGEDNFDAMQVYELVISFQSIWQFSLIIFGVHLLMLSPLVCEKKTFKQWISGVLFVAGIGYILSNMADLFITNYDELYREKVELAFILPMVLGEVLLAFWLLIKGGKEREITGQKQLVVS
ncbi:DUF4386 domain-containing protein [Parvicella tangerina]|uniref:DUF4386 domain-containing protein n=1 Tax=Parvicella tangerina TaxID=2829795 RepID=A0A916JM07_9FLAO|nr:DUF4386 domain-containing protein [Parvicella tangerina]CAG5080210.1 hypothetical protein CRYO30217_01220 [Parvicella tangerina]